MPNVTNPEHIHATNVQTNDQLLAIYMGSLVRAVIALHNLINNKVSELFSGRIVEFNWSVHFLVMLAFLARC